MLTAYTKYARRAGARAGTFGGRHADSAERRSRADRPAVRDRAGPGRIPGGGAVPGRALPGPDDPARPPGTPGSGDRPRSVRVAGRGPRHRRSAAGRAAAPGPGTGRRDVAGAAPDRGGGTG